MWGLPLNHFLPGVMQQSDKRKWYVYLTLESSDEQNDISSGILVGTGITKNPNCQHNTVLVFVTRGWLGQKHERT